MAMTWYQIERKAEKVGMTLTEVKERARCAEAQNDEYARGWAADLLHEIVCDSAESRSVQDRYYD